MVVARVEGAMVTDAVQRFDALGVGGHGGRLKRRTDHDRVDAKCGLGFDQVATAHTAPGDVGVGTMEHVEDAERSAHPCSLSSRYCAYPICTQVS